MRLIFAASLVGVVGAVINAIAVAAVISLDKLSLALDPGRYGVTVALRMILPMLHGALSARLFYFVGVTFLTIGASLLAKLVFLAQAS